MSIISCALLIYLLINLDSQAKLVRADTSPYSTQAFSSTTDVFNPNASDSTINQQPASQYQQWDNHGKAVGYAADPSIIHTPKPQLPTATFLPSTYPRDAEEGGNLMPMRGRQESTDVVGWHQGELNDAQLTDPYAPDSFIQTPSSSTTRPNQQNDVQQTPTQSNFVNGPLPNLSPVSRFDDPFASTTGFHSVHDSLPNPFPSSGVQSSPQPRSPPPPSYISNLR